MIFFFFVIFFFYKDLITQMKKNVLKLRTKYEEQIQKSNLDRTNANQMLMRLETQLNEGK